MKSAASHKGQIHAAVVFIAYALLFLSILGIATGSATSFLTRIATSEASVDRARTASILAAHPAQSTHEVDLPEQEFNYTGESEATIRFQTGIVPLSSYGRSASFNLTPNSYTSAQERFFNVSDGLCLGETTQNAIKLSRDCDD